MKIYRKKDETLKKTIRKQDGKSNPGWLRELESWDAAISRWDDIFMSEEVDPENARRARQFLAKLTKRIASMKKDIDKAGF